MYICSTHYQSMYVRYASPWDRLLCSMYSQPDPSAQTAKGEIKLPPPLHLADRDPNGLRGNIRLLNSTTRSPAVTVYCCFCRLLHARCCWNSWLLCLNNVCPCHVWGKWGWHSFFPLNSNKLWMLMYGGVFFPIRGSTLTLVERRSLWGRYKVKNTWWHSFA